MIKLVVSITLMLLYFFVAYISYTTGKKDMDNVWGQCTQDAYQYGKGKAIEVWLCTRGRNKWKQQ